MPVQDDKAKLIESIHNSKHLLGHYMHNESPTVLLGLDLTIAQLKSLAYIYHQGSINFKQLATALAVSPPNVTGIIDRMVEQGLVSREYNPQNRRMQILKVTEKGRSILLQLWEMGQGRLSGILNLLSVEELIALDKGLSALVRVSKQLSEATDKSK